MTFVCLLLEAVTKPRHGLAMLNPSLLWPHTGELLMLLLPTAGVLLLVIICSPLHMYLLWVLA